MTAPQPRIGVFGGTFDPVHLGHLIVAAEMRYALALDRLLFVPAGRPPHKADRVITDDASRLAMLRLALRDAPQFEISTIDLERPGTSYTADLLGLLNERLAPAHLVFLMGDDSLRDLPTWHEPNRIAALAELGVAGRPGVEYDLDAVLHAVPQARGRIHFVKVPLIEISSAAIRERVSTGAPFVYLVSAEVAAFIRDNGLYR